MATAAIISLTAFWFVITMQRQLHRLRHQSADASLLLPYVQTIGDLLDSAKDAKSLLKILEDSRFRSISLTLYSRDGQIFMDSAIPTYGKLPMPANARQTAVYELIVAKGEENMAKGVVATIQRSCNPRGGEIETTSLAAVSVPNISAILVAQSCGEEN